MWPVIPWIAGATLAASCGSHPSGPTPTPPLSGAASVTGRIVTNQTGAPVAGVTLTITASGQSSVLSDSTGGFAMSGVPIGPVFYSLSKPAYLTHRSRLSVPTAGPVTLDLIAEEPPFSLTFYREFARNARESTILTPINPWTMASSFYIQTVVEDTGEEVAASVIDGLRRIITNSVPELTGRRFNVERIETGSDVRPQQEGWVNVLFRREGLPLGAAGLATVGRNAATILVLYQPDVCRVCLPVCDSMTEWSFDHEIVHAMGYYHTATTGSFHSGDGCPGSGRPAIVQYHAKIMYSRPPGNMDPDTDPPGFITPSSLGASLPSPQITVSCPLPPGWRPK